jgi:hypothetical protein
MIINAATPNMAVESAYPLGPMLARINAIRSKINESKPNEYATKRPVLVCPDR